MSFLGRTIWVKVLSQPNRSSGDVRSPWVHILSKDPFPAGGEPKVYIQSRSLTSRGRAKSSYIHLVPRSFPSRIRARGFIQSKILSQQIQQRSREFSRSVGSHPVPRSFPSRSRSFYIHLVPRSFLIRSRARRFHIQLVQDPFSPEVEPGVFTSSWSKILSHQK